MSIPSSPDCSARAEQSSPKSTADTDDIHLKGSVMGSVDRSDTINDDTSTVQSDVVEVQES